MKLEGKVAIVLGGARGIGKGCVDQLLVKGAKLIIADILDELGEQVAKDARDKYGDQSAIYRHCDTCKEEEIESLFETSMSTYGEKPEIVFTTAGVVDEKNWQRCLDINVGGCIRLVNAALKYLGKDNGGPGGCVILTSSISGIQPEFWGPVYSASKHAVIALARSWAEEANFSKHGIRFNVVCPGGVRTAFQQQARNAYHVDWHLNRIKEMQTFQPAEIANAFMKLLEDDSANGKALRLTFDLGTHYVEFPKGVYA